jgi:hypothetical protein
MSATAPNQAGAMPTTAEYLGAIQQSPCPPNPGTPFAQPFAMVGSGLTARVLQRQHCPAGHVQPARAGDESAHG